MSKKTPTKSTWKRFTINELGHPCLNGEVIPDCCGYSVESMPGQASILTMRIYVNTADHDPSAKEESFPADQLLPEDVESVRYMDGYVFEGEGDIREVTKDGEPIKPDRDAALNETIPVSGYNDDGSLFESEVPARPEE